MGEEKVASLLPTGSDGVELEGPGAAPLAAALPLTLPVPPPSPADSHTQGEWHVSWRWLFGDPDVSGAGLSHVPSIRFSHQPNIRHILQVGKLKLRDVRSFAPDLVGCEARSL